MPVRAGRARCHSINIADAGQVAQPGAKEEFSPTLGRTLLCKEYVKTLSECPARRLFNCNRVSGCASLAMCAYSCAKG